MYGHPSEYTLRPRAHYGGSVMRSGLRAVLIAVVVGVAAAALWFALLQVRVRQEGDRFDFVRWEAQALPNRAVYLLGRPWRSEPSPDEAIERYFELSDRATPEAARLEGTVESAIESRVSAVLHDAGIGWPLPGQLPPVDIELASSPRILVVSPRSRIERLQAEPLRPDLDRSAAQAIEASEERSSDRSALVVPSGGIATYPAIVAIGDSYRDTVSASAHEWTHHYLSLYPLGLAYFTSDEARTINETVADIVGDAVATSVLTRFGDPTQPPTPTLSASPRVDLVTTLRDLRIEVDAMLAQGRIDDAERRMEAVRLDLASKGVNIRRINQAYFAWYGTYAARPESTDPLGGQLRAVLQRSGSLRAFVSAIREVRTRADVARLANR